MVMPAGMCYSALHAFAELKNLGSFCQEVKLLIDHRILEKRPNVLRLRKIWQISAFELFMSNFRHIEILIFEIEKLRFSYKLIEYYYCVKEKNSICR